jgi:hypothetical protein
LSPNQAHTANKMLTKRNMKITHKSFTEKVVGV